MIGLSGPQAIAFDAVGNVYVANSSNDTVSEFAPGTTTPSVTLTGLYKPTDLAFDNNGNLFVADNNDGSVSEFFPGNTTPSVIYGGLYSPYRMAFDGKNNFYVINQGDSTVHKFAGGPAIYDGNQGNDYTVHTVTNTTGVILAAMATNLDVETSKTSSLYGTPVTFTITVTNSGGSTLRPVMWRFSITQLTIWVPRPSKTRADQTLFGA